MPDAQPEVSVIVVAYRRLDLVERAVASVLASTGIDLEVVVVNNDRGLPVGAWAATVGDARLSVVEAGFNSGYAGGVNRGVAASRGRYVFFQNQDLTVAPDHLAQLTAFMEAHPRAGAASGKILRSGGEAPMIDTAGIFMKRHRGAYDRGEGTPDVGQFDTVSEVFAASGAGFFARRSALEDVGPRGRPLDEAFFMYKEEVDLCWRLRLRGWECWYVPAAVAWHGRTSASLGGRGFVAGARDYWRLVRARPAHVRLHSLKNQWLMLVKDADLADVVRSPQILVREAMLFAVTLVTSPPIAVRAVLSFLRAAPAVVRERRRVQSRRVVGRGALAVWFRQ
ncbi:MAG: glycosyltransferase family 2 protein [Dehalococcoidia bacterium]